LKKLGAMGLIATGARNGRANTYFLLEPGCDLAEITTRYDGLKKGRARIVPTPTRTDTPISLGRGPLPAQSPQLEYVVVDRSSPIYLQQQYIKSKNRANSAEKDETKAIYQALTDFGVLPDVAMELLNNEPPAQAVTLSATKRWIEYAADISKRIRNPPGFVVDRLRKGADPPPPKIRRGSQEDRYRYIQGEFAEFIEH
jgi:hypothetical protein